MQITFDPRELTNGQLEALAGFLINFNGPCIVDRQNMQDASATEMLYRGSTGYIKSDIPAAEDIKSDIPSAEEAFGENHLAYPYVPTSVIAEEAFGDNPLPKPILWSDKTPDQIYSDMKEVLAATMPVATPTNPHLDKNGLPWDDRIHSGSRARNADGSWRYKRGVADTWVVEVEKELRALMAIPAPSDNHPIAQENRPIPPPPEALAVQTMKKVLEAPSGIERMVAIPPVPAVPAVPSLVPLASPVSSPPSVPPPPPPAASSEGPFVTLVKKVGALIPAGKLTQEEAKAACMAVGVNELYLLSNRHDLCPAVDAAIDAIVAAR